jgi:hypothetical protein
MLVRTAILAALLLPSMSNAQTAPLTYAYGFGVQSCAYWQDPAGKVGGDQWILGFWSAANMFEKKDVAAASDGMGIIAEVALICRQSPSTTLINAALAARWKISGSTR